MSASRPLRVCYFGTYRADYSRNRILIKGLRRNGVEVVECHAPLWKGVEDRVQAVSGSWRTPAFWARVVRTYALLLWRYAGIGGRYDVLVVGYPGQFDVFLARLLSGWHGKPLVWDIFMSIYLIALERRLHETAPRIVRWLGQLERLACHLPDRLILDTEEYVSWFGRAHGIAPERFRLVPTGADDDAFQPVDGPPPAAHETQPAFRVVYYGTFIRNHGTEFIIEAARQLADVEDIHFELIGQGPERAQAEALARQAGLTNVTFVDWLDQPALVQRVAAGDLCLGVFGTTPQSLMTVQNKIYEALALRKPLLTGKGPAVNSALQHGIHAYLCPRADADALAEAVLTLRRDGFLRRKLAENGYWLYRNHFTVEQLGKRYHDHLLDVLAGRQRRMPSARRRGLWQTLVARLWAAAQSGKG